MGEEGGEKGWAGRGGERGGGEMEKKKGRRTAGKEVF